jgi:hypothetical protein
MQLIFVMEKCDVFFEVRTEFFKIIYMNVYFKLLIHKCLLEAAINII